MEKKKDWSLAAQFLLAAKAARPSYLGDREYSKMLWDLLNLAITRRMVFDPDEFHALNNVLGFRTSVGVFDLDNPGMYSLACWSESGFAVAYERAKGLSPWRAPAIMALQDIYPDIEGIPGVSNFGRIGTGDDFFRKRETLKGKARPRVGIGLHVRVPGRIGILRCTAISDTLIRFVSAVPQPDGSTRRYAFDREQWDNLFPKPEKVKSPEKM